MAQSEDVIRRTVYVSDIDLQVTEEQLAALFISCGQRVQGMLCVLLAQCLGITLSECFHQKLQLHLLIQCFCQDPRMKGRCAQELFTVQIWIGRLLKLILDCSLNPFAERFAVNRLRLLGDYDHPTRIAFVEFVMAVSAIAALKCSGAVLGSFPVRVSPSKTPVRPRTPRLPIH